MGFIVGEDEIEINEDVFELTVQHGFNPEYTRKCLFLNKHNHCTATYYLLLKNFKKTGGAKLISLFTETSLQNNNNSNMSITQKGSSNGASRKDKIRNPKNQTKEIVLDSASLLDSIEVSNHTSINASSAHAKPNSQQYSASQTTDATYQKR